jgi:hypothetical protein
MSSSNESFSLHRIRHLVRRHHRLGAQRQNRIVFAGGVVLLAVLSWTYSRGTHIVVPDTVARSARDRGAPKQRNAVTDPLQAIDINKFLEALSACESGHNDYAVGKKGERSRYQIRQSTWAFCGFNNFETDSKNPAIARACAITYLRTLATVLTDHEIVPNAQNLATMWNRGTLNRGHNDFSTRVSNLYHDAFKSQTTHPSPSIVQASNRR